jgi:hypothetical protein
MNYPTSPHRIISEAELKEMEARIKQLEEALRPFANALWEVQVPNEFAFNTVVEFSPILDRWPYEEAAKALAAEKEAP